MIPRIMCWMLQINVSGCNVAEEMKWDEEGEERYIYRERERERERDPLVEEKSRGSIELKEGEGKGALIYSERN
jgi:hypothetical protein